MKKLIILLLTLAIVAVIPLFFAGRMINNYAVKAIETATGFKAAFGSIDVGILRPEIHIKDVQLTNPSDFPHPELLTISELYVKYDRLSLLSRDIKLREVRIDIPRVVMVKPESGKSNFEKIDDLFDQPASVPSSPAPGAPPSADGPTPNAGEVTTAPAEKSRSVTIDRLNVKLGEMEVRQYLGNRSEPVVLPVKVNLDRSFTNVTDAQDVADELIRDLTMRSTMNLLGNMEAVMEAVTDENGKLDKRIRDQLKDLKKLFQP